MQQTKQIQDKFITYDVPTEGYYNPNASEVVSSVYVNAVREGWRLTEIEEEAADEEILRCIEKSGHFDFLKDSAEDIYNLEDGEEV